MRIVDAGYGHAEAALLERILSRPLFAHLATQSDAGPRESPVWFLWETTAIWIIGNVKDSFLQRAASDPRCALGIVDFDLATGRVWHAGIRGIASIEFWDPARACRLLARYLGGDPARWHARFRSAVNDETNRWIRLEPDTVVVRDQSYGSVLSRE